MHQQNCDAFYLYVYNIKKYNAIIFTAILHNAMLVRYMIDYRRK